MDERRDGVLIPGGAAIAEPMETPSGVRQLRASVLRFPDLGFRVLDDAVVNPRCGGILTADGLVQRRTVSPEDARFSSLTVPGYRADDGVRAVTAWRRETRVDAAIFLGGTWSDNYYHWMTEHLPILHLAAGLPPSLRDLPVIVSELALGVPNIRASLELFRDGRKLIPGAPWQTFRVGRLVVIDAPKTVSALQPGDTSLQGVESYHAEGMRRFRADLLERLGLTDAPGDANRRTFIARPAGARRSYNESEVVEALRKRGFEAIDPSRLTLADQAAAFRGAALVCGPSGAAMTNLLFSGDPSRCIVWGDWGRDEPVRSLWANLAAVGGARVLHLDVNGERSGLQRSDDSPAYWSIDPRRILEEL